MKSDKRPKVRPQPQASIEDKVYTPVVRVSKRVPRGRAHPLVVSADLRHGSLKSLNRYLAMHAGIPDPEVALALRELISGPYPQAKFRMLVVEHPDAPKNNGGRPKTKRLTPKMSDFDVADAYEALEPSGKTGAVVQVAKDKPRSEAAVRKAVKLVRDYRERAAVEAVEKAKAEGRRRQLLERREKALSSLRAAARDVD